MTSFAISPQALQEARQVLGTGDNLQGQSMTNAETPDDKMMMTQQKHELDMERERMKQDHAVGMEQFKQQAALGQKYADNNLKAEQMRLQNSLQSAQPRQAQPNQTAQQAVDNQYYNNDAITQVPMYLGNNFS